METGKKVFTPEFKQETLELITRSGKPLSHVARELGISENTVQGWKRQAMIHGKDAFPGSGHQTLQEEEVQRLRRENSILQQERDILKKAIAIFSQPGR